MAKPKIPYRVIRGFEVFRKGTIIYPTGMRKSELLMRGVIEKAEDLIEPAPAPAPPVVEDIEDPADSDPLVVEAAALPEPETASLPEPRRRKRRHVH